MMMPPGQYSDGARDSWEPAADPLGSFAGGSRRFSILARDGPGVRTASDPLGSQAFEAIVAEFTACWERGETVPVEAFLERMGSAHPADVVELIYHEFCLAESMGKKPDPSDFMRRFPDRRDSLDRLFRLHGALSSAQLRDLVDPNVLPETGDEIGPYILLRELGRGSFARVYLAEQADLDHRLVVVKISTRLTPEPRLLARARHSHIVEVLWHGSAEDGTLQLICLPFLGGATLASVLAERAGKRRRPRGGRDFLADLDRVSAPEYPKANLSRPAREVVERLSYPATVAWIGARLAEALDHAFARGVAHGDIKPSNILLTADGNPMLLDFNLAVGWRLPGADELPADGGGGGTLAYMAPERLRAIAEIQRPTTPRAAERHRADIFALGVVLLEALTCRAPDLPQARVRTRREVAEMLSQTARDGGEALRWLARSSVPSGLRSILSRCLAPDPADRYRRASDLAEDLDRWRTERALAFADEPAWPNRVGRWIRRQRIAVAATLLALVIGASALFVVWNSFQSTLRTQAEDRLSLNWDRRDTGAFRYLRYGQWRPTDMRDPVEVAQELLKLYNVIEDPDWRRRNDVRNLSEPDRLELEVWLLEQVLRYTRALGERPDSPDDWRRALTLLDRTYPDFPLGPLDTERRLLRGKLKRAEPPPTAQDRNSARPPGWMEEYLLGVEAEPDRADRALNHYLAVIKVRPDSFWAHYRAATVAYRLGDRAAAAEHLRACLKRRPRNVALHAQLAACLYGQLQYDDALEECDIALEIEPDHTVSTRIRSFIRAQLGQGDGLMADLGRLTLLSHSPKEARALELQLIPKSSRERLSGEGSEVTSLDDDPATGVLRAVILRDSGHPHDALLELDKLLALEPEHLQARYHRAMLLRKLDSGNGRQAEADFEYLVKHPRFQELLAQDKEAVRIYHQHSTDLLHAGKAAEAVDVARRGLIAALRLRSNIAQSHYTLARAYAESARTEPAHARLAFGELQDAVRIQPGFLKTFEEDPRFDALRCNFRKSLGRRP